ncbi:MAG: STAS domain-containing protein [Salinivirgaceae bacterium]|nr:STAS domain-containing protein [Salinivirgaceae bacterium]
MEIVTKKDNSFTVFEIKGRLDTTNYLDLEKEFTRQIDNGDRQILVDCDRLDYVSSSGLRVFLIALKELKKLGGKFVMCNLQNSIQEIFEISGFISIFDVYQTKDEARKVFNN